MEVKTGVVGVGAIGKKPRPVYAELEDLRPGRHLRREPRAREGPRRTKFGTESGVATLEN